MLYNSILLYIADLNSGIIATGIQSDGTLGTTGYLEISSTGNTILSGNTISAGDMMIAAEGDLTNTNLILSKGNTLIESNNRLINTGTIVTENDTKIFGNNSVRSTGLILAGIDENGNATGSLEIYSNGDVNLSGTTTAAGDIMLISSYGGSILNNNGTIQAGEAIFALAGDTINNDNGIIVQTKDIPVTQGIHLQANSISNVNGKILSAGTANSGVATVELLAFQNFSWLGAEPGNNIDNTNGQIVSNGSIALAGWDINNIGGNVKAQGFIDLLAENAINNTRTGPDTGIIKGSDIVVYANSLNNYLGEIVGYNTVTLNGKPGQDFYTEIFYPSGVMTIPSNLGMDKTGVLAISNAGWIAAGDNIQLYKVSHFPAGLVTPRVYWAEKNKWIYTADIPTIGNEHIYNWHDPIDQLSVYLLVAGGVFSKTAGELALESKVTSDAVRYTPINPGPLSAEVAQTFRSATYTAYTTEVETVLYRVYGGEAGELGNYWTRTSPQGPLQAVIDSALSRIWGNTATEIVKIRVPSGVQLYEGAAAAQGGLVGGGNQIWIKEVLSSWIVR